MRETIEERNARFWNKVDKLNGPTMPHMESPCWPWTASLVGGGYGQFTIGGKTVRANRVAWEMVHGALPPGQCALHRCDYRKCVRESHLFAGTKKRNTHDMMSKDRQDGFVRPAKRPRGVRHGLAKMNDDKVRALRRRSDAGEPITRLARFFGIDKSTARAIADRETWKHIPEDVAVAPQ